MYNYDTTKTLFQNWQAGNIANFGSFQTTILKAYQLADFGNRKRLESAFPDWFTMEEEKPLMKKVS